MDDAAGTVYARANALALQALSRDEEDDRAYVRERLAFLHGPYGHGPGLHPRPAPHRAGAGRRDPGRLRRPAAPAQPPPAGPQPPAAHPGQPGVVLGMPV